MPDRTTDATGGEETPAAVWLLSISGLLFVLAGWLLPWYVEGTAGGVGYSPQDVIFSFGGAGTMLVYLLAVVMLALLGACGYDIAAQLLEQRMHHRRPCIFATVRGVLALAGIAITLLIVADVSIGGDELFGKLDQYAYIDNAVWMTITGYVLIAIACGLRPLVIRHPGGTIAVVSAVLGIAFPGIFYRANDFIGWGARFAAIYVLLALGLNVVVGFAGLLDLGYAAFFAIGAYTTASFSSDKYDIHLPFWVLVFLGAGVAAVFGGVLGAPTLRLRGDYLAIVTLGFGEIVPDIANNNLLGLTGGPNGLAADPASLTRTHFALPHLPTVDIPGTNLGPLGAFAYNPKYYFWIILTLIFITILGLRNLERSRLGRAWVAIREDEVAAAATGINLVSTKLLAFAIGASVSGFAGAFFGAMLGTVTPDNFQFAVSVTALSTVVLGGIGSIAGVCVGALLIAFVIDWILPNAQEWSQTLGGTTGITELNNVDFSRYAYVCYGLVLVGIMLIRPGGLIPSRARRVELTADAEIEEPAAGSLVT